jgi:hypothetical protein
MLRTAEIREVDGPCGFLFVSLINALEEEEELQ